MSDNARSLLSLTRRRRSLVQMRGFLLFALEICETSLSDCEKTLAQKFASSPVANTETGQVVHISTSRSTDSLNASVVQVPELGRV